MTARAALKRNRAAIMLVIVTEVAAQHGQAVADLMGRCRRRPSFRARAEAMRVMRKRGFSLYDIGLFFNRDHTTVMWAIERIEALPLSFVERARSEPLAARWLPLFEPPSQPWPNEAWEACWRAAEAAWGRTRRYDRVSEPQALAIYKPAISVPMVSSGVSSIYDHGQVKGDDWYKSRRPPRGLWESQPNNFGGSGR